MSQSFTDLKILRTLNSIIIHLRTIEINDVKVLQLKEKSENLMETVLLLKLPSENLDYIF
jgi:hypothetical protein